MRIEVIIAPETEPISLDEAKQFCRIDTDLTDENDLISSLITAAREQIEVQTGRAFAVQTLRVTLDKFPTKSLSVVLPRGPLLEVVSVDYDDADGEEQTMDEADYTVHPYGMLGAIQAVTSWPITSGAHGCVRITYSCGYSVPPTGEDEAESELIPARARTAILYMINHWYERRDAVIVGSISSVLPMAVHSLIAPLKTFYRISE